MIYTATIKSGDPYKLGGYERVVSGSVEEIIKEADSIWDRVWREMNRNGEPYISITIDGHTFNRGLYSAEIPKTMGEYRNPPQPGKGYSFYVEKYHVAYALVGLPPEEAKSYEDIDTILKAAEKLPDSTVLDWENPVLKWKSGNARFHKLSEENGELVFAEFSPGYYTQEEIKEITEARPEELLKAREWESLLEEFPDLTPAQLAVQWDIKQMAIKADGQIKG